MTKLRVIMTGPLPPLIGGMVTVINDLNNSSLSQKVDLVLFNTGKATIVGRSIVVAVYAKLKQYWSWRKLLRGQQQTIIHIHTCSGLSYFFDGVLILMAKFYSVPVVLHIHGAKFDLFLEELSQWQFNIAHWLLKKCACIVVLSDSWKEKLKIIFPDVEFSVVSNGVPIHQQKRETSTRSKANIQMLFLGNLSQRKGVFDLLEAMKSIDGVELNLVGGEDEAGISQQILQIIAKNGLEQKITLAGPKYGSGKMEFLQNADIFVLPSYAEGLPISLLEAMSVGLPVIVTPVGGIPSVITDNQEGILVNAGNVAQLAQAINRLAENPILRSQMGNTARKRCEEEYGIEQTVDKLTHLYQKLSTQVNCSRDD